LSEKELTKNPVGIFDSGIGGLSILREVLRLYPGENLFYVADHAHVPYGSRSLEEVRQLSFAIVDFLLDQGAKLITVACNTASAASLHALRERYPEIPFVGMEPAVKPAAENTQSHTVGVLATPTTFQGALFASVVERFADGVTVLQETLPGLVQQIEKGELDSDLTREILEAGVLPLIDQGADTLVLACTHFPFIIPLLQDIVGNGVQVIDPSPAIARQVGHLLNQHNLRNTDPDGGSLRYVTSGDELTFETTLQTLSFPIGEVLSASWEQGQLKKS
jgi:glutamate racemase